MENAVKGQGQNLNQSWSDVKTCGLKEMCGSKEKEPCVKVYFKGASMLLTGSWEQEEVGLDQQK
jgi:hypothetical protein